jgi:hypothetical protein
VTTNENEDPTIESDMLSVMISAPCPDVLSPEDRDLLADLLAAKEEPNADG